MFKITRPDGSTLAERETREEAIRVALFNATQHGPLTVTAPDGKLVAEAR